MEKRVFDVIVIGAGSGLRIASVAADLGLKVAIIEKGPFGGTCLNRGCIPSKMLIHVADIAGTVLDARRIGITAKVQKIDWEGVRRRVWKLVDGEAEGIEEANHKIKNVKVYKAEASFVDFKTLKVGKDQITAEKIFICAGTRPTIPQLPGLENVQYATSDNVMRLKKQPKSMIILGGGYIAAELGHFFSSIGTKVTLINRSGMLVKHEDDEIATTFTRIVQKKYAVLLNAPIVQVSRRGKKIVVEAEQNRKKKKIAAEVLLVATGRTPNTDILKVGNSGVNINKDGYVMTNAYLETNVPGIWAIGDIVGKYLFKHSANLEADACAQNSFNPESKKPVDYTAMPHAIFTSPQIAGVGMTEQDLKEKKIPYRAGRYKYYSTGMGRALEDRDGFVKVLADPVTKKILGCHIIGSDASTLIHEMIIAMKAGLTVDDVVNTVHIHPALPEVVQRACASVTW